jgi:hypothetical protein
MFSRPLRRKSSVIVLAAGTLCIPRSSADASSLRPPQAGCLSRKLKICALHLGPNLIGDEIVDAGSFALNPRTPSLDKL